MIENASIESLKNTIDIVDVIGNYIELKKAGANYKANCPFHGEKTPSFVVSPSKQIYHCFGCGAGGDAVKFMMELEKLTYPEAIEKLAAMYNFSLRYTQGSSDYSDAKRVLETIQTWYVKNLDQNQIAMAYLKGRSISAASIEKFGIGFVPSGSQVMQFLQSRMLPPAQAVEAGIIAQGERGEYYARLVERITFPIYSTAGSIVGFGGRTITNHPAKYINSPQTKLFNKSRLLYGYHLAKEHIYQKKQLIVCEGYLDVIMFHQAGFDTAVATLGTALTKDHLPLLRKGEPKVILAYDGDSAGIAAALKAAIMLSSSGFEGGVVLFPNGQDPADLIAKGESETVAKLLREAKPLIPFVIEKITQSYDLSEPRNKEVAFGQIKQFLDGLSQIIKDAYIPLAATQLGISASLFGSQVQTSKLKERFVQHKEDTELLNILKTLLENPDLIDSVMDTVDINMFGGYSKYFELLVNNDYSHPFLVGLQLKENVHSLSQEQLMFALRNLLIRHYETQLKSIPQNMTLSSDKKMYLIRKIKTDIIPRLKRGELVTYDKLV